MTGVKRKVVPAALILGLFFCAPGCGRPVYFNNQPLRNPVRLVSLDAPATARLSDGRTVQLAGIRLLGPVNLAQSFGEAVAAAGTVEVDAPPAGATVTRLRYQADSRSQCGNTRGFLPAFHAADVGMQLVVRGQALPTRDGFRKDPSYATQLAAALSRAHPLPAVPKDDAEAAELGRLLLDRRPRVGDPARLDGATAGARLLAAAAAPDAGERILEALRDRAAATHGSPELFKVLIAVDSDMARRAMLAAATKRPAGHQWMQTIVLLLDLGDWSTLDGAVAQLESATREGTMLDDRFRNGVGHDLEQMLGFQYLGGVRYEEHYSRLAAWYRGVRPRLRYEGAPGGLPQFSLKSPNGRWSREAYFRSMLPHLAGPPEAIRRMYGAYLP